MLNKESMPPCRIDQDDDADSGGDSFGSDDDEYGLNRKIDYNNFPYHEYHYCKDTTKSFILNPEEAEKL